MSSREEMLLRRLVRWIRIGILAAAALWALLPGWLNRPRPQPVAFDHSLHAGAREISCVFCHTGARQGDMAGVPSAEDCWQCHQAVRVVAEDKDKIDAFIERYRARRADAVAWYRYYNLPRHVHFSHRAHALGGVDCARCHGDVARMREIQPVSGWLTMTWCVDCHRRELGKNPNLTDCSVCHY